MAPRRQRGLIRRKAEGHGSSSRFIRTVDSLITPERLRIYPLLLLVGSSLGLMFSTVVRISDPASIGAFMPDYLAHWTGGRLLLTPGTQNLYDPVTQSILQVSMLGAEVPLSWFASPPVVAVFYAPLALLPYSLSGLVWLTISTALLLWCILSLKNLARGLLARKKLTIVLTVLASPVVFELLGGGQDSAFILAAWLIGIQLLTRNHSIWAGAVLGLGFAKPQLVVIVPLVFLVTRNYRALVSFTAVCALLSGISLWAVGLAGIEQWLGALSSPLYLEEVQHGQAWKMLGLPSFLQALAPPGWEGWTAPLLTLFPLPVGAAILLTQAYKRRRAERQTAALWLAALATTVTFSPHVVSYDAILFVPVIVYLLERRPSPLLRVSVVSAFALIYIMPLLHVVAVQLSWPLSVLEAPWAAIPLAVIWWQAIKELGPPTTCPAGCSPAAREQPLSEGAGEAGQH